MRINLLLAATIAAPVLAVVVGCGATTTTAHTPLKGTVTEKQYKAAKRGAARVPTTTKVCKTDKNKRTCSTVVTGYTKQPSVIRDECYELDIQSDYSGQETEVCNRAAFLVLKIGDRYDSSVNYSKRSHR